MRKSTKLTFSVLIMIALLFAPRTSYAHAFSAAFTTLNLSQNETELIYSIDTISIIEGIGGDQNKDGELNEQELSGIKYRLQEWIEDNVVLEVDGKQQTPTLLSLEIEKKGDKEVGTAHFKYPAYAVGKTVKILDGIFYEGQNFSTYTNFVKVNYDGQVSDAVLQGKNRDWTMLLAESQQQQQQSDQTATQNTKQPQKGHTSWQSFLILGMKHILTGYDHLLFIFALLLRKQTLKKYITTVTAFTIAHSITLSLAVTGIFDLPSRFVESMIALSICYIAFENIFKKEIKYRWIITFFFGLIHGLGFASILKELELPKSDLAIALFNFNIGIEFVQILIVICIVPLLFLLQKIESYRSYVNIGSAVIFILGAIWLFQRVFA